MDRSTQAEHLETLIERLGMDHAGLRAELARLGALIASFTASDRDARTWLGELTEAHAELERELLTHLAKEERLLFPYARRLAHASRRAERLDAPPFRTARNPIAILSCEHEAAQIYAARVQQLASAPLAGAWGGRPSTLALYALLEEHVALEREVLFPAILNVEEAVLIRSAS